MANKRHEQKSLIHLKTRMFTIVNDYVSIEA